MPCMWKTHTFIGMTSGKEVFRLVQWLYIAGTSAMDSECTLVQHGRDTRGEGSHWWNVALKTPQTSRHRALVTADLQAPAAASDSDQRQHLWCWYKGCLKSLATRICPLWQQCDDQVKLSYFIVDGKESSWVSSNCHQFKCDSVMTRNMTSR